jgi:hypothetical protein
MRISSQLLLSSAYNLVFPAFFAFAHRALAAADNAARAAALNFRFRHRAGFAPTALLPRLTLAPELGRPRVLPILKLPAGPKTSANCF